MIGKLFQKPLAAYEPNPKQKHSRFIQLAFSHFYILALGGLPGLRAHGGAINWFKLFIRFNLFNCVLFSHVHYSYLSRYIFVYVNYCCIKIMFLSLVPLPPFSFSPLPANTFAPTMRCYSVACTAPSVPFLASAFACRT